MDFGHYVVLLPVRYIIYIMVCSSQVLLVTYHDLNIA